MVLAMNTSTSAKFPLKLLSWLSRPFILAVILFAAINCLLCNQTKNLQAADTIVQEGLANPMSRTFTGWTARAYASQKQAPDIVLFGSSQMGSAVFASDAKTLQQALDFVKHRRGSTLEKHLGQQLQQPLTVFNWALGGSMISDAYLESLCLLNGRLKPKMVIIGVNPRDFIDNSLPNAGSTEQFRYFSRFIKADDLGTLAFPNLLDRGNWLMNVKMPLRKIGIDIQHQLAVQASHNSDKSLIDAEKSPVKKPASGASDFMQGISTTGVDVKPGQWVMPANMPTIFVDNTNEYVHRYRNPNPPGYAAQLQFFNRLLALLKSADIPVVVVGMPSLWPNRVLLPDSFWSQWRQTVAADCRQHGAQFLDWTDSNDFVIDDYLDTVHMNAAGGNKIFRMLSSYIAGNASLAAKLNANSRSLADSNKITY